MQRLYTILFLVIFISSYTSNAQIAQWAEGISADEVKIYATTTDPKYDVSYIAGYFIGDRLEFNNGISIENTDNLNFISFLAQYDETGKCLWARAIYNANWIYDISINPVNNDVLFCGVFNTDSMSFETGNTFYNVYDLPYYRTNSFFAVYGANGYFKDARHIHGDDGNQDTTHRGEAFALSIIADNNGDIFITGDGYGSVQFGNGKQVQFTANVYHARITSFIAKYDAWDLNCQWVSTYKAQGYYSTFDSFSFINSKRIRIDRNGELYVVGNYWSDSIIFPSNKVVARGDNMSATGGFIARFNNAGDCAWARNIEALSGSVKINDLSIDSSFSIYVTGNFTANATLSFGNDVFYSLDTNLYPGDYGYSSATFVARYHNFTGDCTWGQAFIAYGGMRILNGVEEHSSALVPTGLSTDPEGNSYIVGYSLAKDVYFNNNISLIGLSNEQYNIFFTKINRYGETQYAHSSIVGPHYNTIFRTNELVDDFRIAYDRSGSFNITGLFKSDSVYINNGISLYHSGENVRDGFITRFDTTRYANLPAPSLIAPANASIHISKNSTFEWDAIRDANAYIVQLDKDISFQNPTEKKVLLINNTNILDLEPDTEYVWRVKAIHTGTGGESNWSNIRSFISFRLPTLDTINISNITSSTARVRANVISDGGEEVVNRGVCWSLEPYPSIDDNKRYSGSGEGEFETYLRFLMPGTRYYVRAFAQNEAGIVYSQSQLVQRELSFTTNEFDIITLYSAGNNGAGQIGDSTQTNTRKTFTLVKNNYGWHKIALGDKHVAAIRTDGTLWTWGESVALGRDTRAASGLVPNQVGDDNDWIDVACGIRWTMALKSDGSLWGTGNNDKSQLGRDNRASISEMVKINNIDRWIKVAAGREHVLAIRDDSTLWAWGYNNSGSHRHLIDIDSFQIVSPKQIAPDSSIKWAKVFAGQSSSFAISDRGTLYAWGRASDIGYGGNRDTLIPIIIGNSNDKWIKVSPSNGSTMALRDDGTLWSWGGNYGQLGRDTPGNSDYNPGKIGTDSNWIDVAKSYLNTIAIKDNGSLWCFGTHSNFEFGDSTLPNPVWNPAQIGLNIGLDSTWTMIPDGLPTNFRVYGSKSNINLPDLQSRSITVVGDSALFYGYVHSDGGGEIYNRGVCWSGYTSEPTINGEVIYENSENKLGEYYGYLPKLIPNTQYYVRMFATNAAGTVYSETLVFTSAPSYPVIETVGALNIDETSFDAKGHISNDGGSNITEKGICYASHNNPTINDNKVVSDDEWLTGTYTVSIENLISGATYYYRAYAINARGVGYGDIDSIITDHNTQSIDLNVGWNMISSYILPPSTSISAIFDGYTASVVLVKDVQGNIYLPDFGIDNIHTWDIDKAYQVYLSESRILAINGSVIEPENTPIELNANSWAMIPYLRNNSLDASEALSTLLNDNALVLAKDISGKTYIPEFGINTIGNLESGQGYQVYLSKNSTLTYPANSSGKQIISEATPSAKHLIPNYIRTGNSAVAILELKAPNGSEIGVYNDKSELLGSGAVYNGRVALTIWGDNYQTQAIDGAKTNEILTIRYFDAEKNEFKEVNIESISDYLTGAELKGLNYQENLVIYAKINVEGLAESLSMSVSPNPASDKIEITLTTSDCSNTTLKLYDMSGRLVRDLSSEMINSNNQSLSVNFGTLTSGEYNIILTCGNEKISKSVMIVR